MREAKIKISADVASLRNAVNQAKESLESLSKAKIDNKSVEAIKDAFGKELQEGIVEATSKLDKLNEKIGELSKTAEGALSDEFKKANADAKVLNETLDKLKRTKKELETGSGINVGNATPSGGGGGAGTGAMGMLRGGAMKLAGAVGLGLGINHFRNVAERMSNQRVGIRSLTGGADVGEESQLGFKPNERRERATSIAQAIGRNMSSEELTNLTDFGEQSQRAFGMEQGTLSAMMSQGSKAGVEDQQKMLASSMGTAVAAGMEGSRVGEYLSAMTGFMSEMADSITVDTDSINGFASAFGDIPFFKNDPSRLFNQMRGIDGAFKNGDRFQQAQAARAMLKENPNASPAQLELRRSLGLFSNTDGVANAFAGIKGTEGLQKTLRMSGQDILKNQFDEAMGSTKGMEAGERVHDVMSRLGLQGEGGMRVVASLMKGEDVNKKDLQVAQMSPEEQLKIKMQESMNASFKGMEKGMLDMASDIASIEEKIAGNIGTALTGIYETLKGIAEKMGIESGTDMVADVATAGIGAAAVGGAAKMMLGKGAKETVKNTAKNGAKKLGNSALGRMVGGKLIPGLGTAYTALESENLGQAGVTDMAVTDANSFDVMNTMKESNMPVPDSLKNANVPWAGGLTQKEENAARMYNPANVVAQNPSEVNIPSNMTVNDPQVVQEIRNLANVLTGKGQPVPLPIQDRRPAGVYHAGSNTAIGKGR